jgi:CheY-like chemotaxis protein
LNAGHGNAVAAVGLGLIEAFVCGIQQLLGGLAVKSPDFPDLFLPKVSGFELLHEWRSNPRTAEVPVFVLTSKDLMKDERQYLHTHSESLFRKQDSWREPLIKQLGRIVTSGDLEPN